MPPKRTSLPNAIRAFAAFIVCILVAPGLAHAENATPAEAQAMAAHAVEFIKAQGMDAAVAAFDAPGGEWHDRDLYVYILDNTGLSIANGASPHLVGKNLIDLKDVDGKPFVREMLKIHGTGWLDYKWRNPVTKNVEEKQAYYIQYDKYFIGVGIYKDHS